MFVETVTTFSLYIWLPHQLQIIQKLPLFGTQIGNNYNHDGVKLQKNDHKLFPCTKNVHIALINNPVIFQVILEILKVGRFPLQMLLN